MADGGWRGQEGEARPNGSKRICRDLTLDAIGCEQNEPMVNQ